MVVVARQVANAVWRALPCPRLHVTAFDGSQRVVNGLTRLAHSHQHRVCCLCGGGHLPSMSSEGHGIRPIEATSIGNITAGQVIVDIQSAAKELVENSLDAKATSIGMDPWH